MDETKVVTNLTVHECPSGFAVTATWLDADGEERSEHGAFPGPDLLRGLTLWLVNVGAVSTLPSVASAPKVPAGFHRPAIATWADVGRGDLIAPSYRSPLGQPSDADWRKVRSVRSAGSALIEVVCAGESPVKHRPTGEVWVMRRVDAGLSAVAS